MKNLLQNEFQRQVNESTISRALDKQLITLKTLGQEADVHAARNSNENIARKQEFAQWLVDAKHECHMIFVDETGFNMWTRRSQGRSRRGQRVRLVVVTRPRLAQLNNIQVISTSHGLLHHKMLSETLTAAKF